MSDPLQAKLDEAVKAGKVPQAVVFAESRDGTFAYSASAGQTSVAPESQQVIKDDAVFLLASQTKLVTSIAALQAVEQGLIGLDDDVAEIVPQLAEQPVLEGFDEENKPILVERRNAITLRLLLTHSAGTALDIGDAKLLKYQAGRNHPVNTGPDVVSRFTYPLIFQPGESWSYGTGIDWAGLVVERVTQTTLEDLIHKNICDPLGITSMTFFPAKQPELNARVPMLSARTPGGDLAPYTEPSINSGSTGCFGGHGLYSTMSDYLKLQLSILRDDGKLLKPESVETMFTPQLTPVTSAGLKTFMGTPMGAFFIGEMFPERRHDWGIGGILFMEDDEGRRRKGTLSWGGMANSFWCIDREAGLAITFGTQLLPPGEKMCEGVITDVEKGVYSMAAAAGVVDGKL